MIKTDSHIHTSFSSDSDASMESMILAGIEKGLDSMCFTEHFDPCFPITEEDLDFLLDFDAYENTFHSLKERYGDQIDLYHGVELGVQNHIQKECMEFFNTYGSRYDFIINSTHVIDNQDPYYGTYFKSFQTPKEAITHYYEVLYENLKVFHDYQSVGHLDYLCRYEPGERTPFLYKDYSEIIDAILSHLIRHDKALEINTAGWKYGMTDPNPNRQIISRYRELGGKMITIGSDGHKPEHLAYDFHHLPEFLKSLGFDSYLYYKKKQPQEIPL
ncbi:MAG: histidinol-phosphatase HisJ family protein [Eubacteriales bacterium]|nr:histidinol-phosphatase HisJ family protein [Eubacteriales bacterium]